MGLMNRVQQAIDYIEDSLYSQVSLKTVAQGAYLSPFHFHRIFFLLIGESVTTYIRMRRFSMAAAELLTTDKRIIDIALAHGFSSHESFTRSFKKTVGMTPEKYRLCDTPSFQYPRLYLTDNELFRTGEYPVIPLSRIESIEPFQVTGKLLRNLSVSHSSSQMKNNQRAIESMWDTIQPVVAQQYEQVGVIFPTGGLNYDYLAGVRTNKALTVESPVDWVKRDIARQSYAVFKHEGTLAIIPQLYQYIFGTWLAQSDYDLVFGPELEMYRFVADEQTMSLFIEIYIPVKSKHKIARNIK
jgi:AraC family transcriptional regulator